MLRKVINNGHMRKVTMKKLKVKECVICKDKISIEDYGSGKIWDDGHNPWPIRDDGRCCTDCNLFVVVPARMRQHYVRRQNDG